MVNEQEKRIAKILGVEELEDMDDEAVDYTEQNMREYLRYLIENVNHPLSTQPRKFFLCFF